jgi:hypothetical protein
MAVATSLGQGGHSLLVSDPGRGGGGLHAHGHPWAVECMDLHGGLLASVLRGEGHFHFPRPRHNIVSRAVLISVRMPAERYDSLDG